MRKGEPAHREATEDPLIAKVAEMFECNPNLTRVFSKDEWEGILERRRGEHRKFWGAQFDDPPKQE